jgi:hypothetical protein
VKQDRCFPNLPATTFLACGNPVTVAGIVTVICIGDDRINIEIKGNNSRYTKLQREKDYELVTVTKEFTKTVLIRYKTYEQYFGK